MGTEPGTRRCNSFGAGVETRSGATPDTGLTVATGWCGCGGASGAGLGAVSDGLASAGDFEGTISRCEDGFAALFGLRLRAPEPRRSPVAFGGRTILPNNSFVSTY